MLFYFWASVFKHFHSCSECLDMWDDQSSPILPLVSLSLISCPHKAQHSSAVRASKPIIRLVHARNEHYPLSSCYHIVCYSSREGHQCFSGFGKKLIVLPRCLRRTSIGRYCQSPVLVWDIFTPYTSNRFSWISSKVNPSTICQTRWDRLCILKEVS